MLTPSIRCLTHILRFVLQLPENEIEAINTLPRLEDLEASGTDLKAGCRASRIPQYI